MANHFYSDIPSKQKIQRVFESYRPVFMAILRNIQGVLKENIRLSSQPTYKARIKSFDSYYQKVLRQKSSAAVQSDGLICLTDMMGIRIICTFLEDISVVQEQLSRLFEIREVEVKGAGQSFKEFGYESVHVLVAIPPGCVPCMEDGGVGLPLPPELVCEIQIRTILQDAWAEVEHELIYKTEFTPFDMPLRRKLASMNASLSLADIIFQEIRDYQKNLHNEMKARRRSFYDKADALTDEVGTGGGGAQEISIERISPYVRGTIDDLLLQAIHAHNSGNISEAISIYSQIIDAQPAPNATVLSVIYKHRGMAYFTQNDYDCALSDFKESFALDKTNFRSAYYEGIVYAIQKQHERAMACFTKSLELNEYQSHTFYRRAAAYYELKQYENAMNDVIAAQRLGLDDEGLQALHEKLLEKFDMKM